MWFLILSISSKEFQKQYSDYTHDITTIFDISKIESCKKLSVPDVYMLFNGTFMNVGYTRFYVNYVSSDKIRFYRLGG